MLQLQLGKWDADELVQQTEANGLIYQKDRLYVSNDYTTQQELIRLYYNNPLAGYFSSNKTLDILWCTYYQKNIEEDIQMYVQEYNIY